MSFTHSVGADADADHTRPPPRVPSRRRALGRGLAGLSSSILGSGIARDVVALSAEIAALETTIELKGNPRFEPSRLVGQFIQESGPGGAVFPVKFGTLASGYIVIRHENGVYQSDLFWISLVHPALKSRDADTAFGIAVQIVHGVVSGMIGLRRRGVAGFRDALFPAIFGRSYSGPESIELLAPLENQLSDGQLLLRTMFRLQPPDGPPIQGSFRLWDETYSFLADVEVAARGMASTTVPVARKPSGLLTARQPIELAEEWKAKGFSGKMAMSFVDGSFEARSTLALEFPKSSPRLRGSVTVLATTEEKAWAAARSHSPSPSVAGGLEPMGTGSRMALTGWGVLDLTITKGLDAHAAFVVDPEGYVTARGVLRAPRELVLIRPYNWSPNPLIEQSWTLTDLPLWWGVSGAVTASVSLTPGATIGPVTLRDLVIEGLYSTRPGVDSRLDIAASLNASIEAWLDARAKLEGAVEVGIDLPQVCAFGYCTPDLDIDVVSVWVALAGRGVLRGYVDARPRIVRFGGQDPAVGVPTYGIGGHVEVAGEYVIDLALETGGSILGGLASGSGPQFGFAGGAYAVKGGAVALDFEHMIGSASRPRFTFTQPRFDPKKFVRDLRRGAAPRLSGRRPKGFFVDWATGKRTPIQSTAPAALGPIPGADLDLKVPFEIADKPHTLWLVLSRPPIVEVASARQRLSERLFMALQRVEWKRVWEFDDDERKLLEHQNADLDGLIADTRTLEGRAARLGEDPSNLFAAELPGLVELAQRLAEYGERYGDAELTGVALLTSGALEPTVVQPVGAVLAGTDTPVKGNLDAMRSWVATLKRTPQTSTAAWAEYQRQVAGPDEYEAVGGGEKVNADGVAIHETKLIDAKYVGDPSRSPFIPASAFPAKLRSKFQANLDDEFSRYAAVVRDPATPPDGLKVITNNTDAQAYFRGLLAAHGLAGLVTFEEREEP